MLKAIGDLVVQHHRWPQALSVGIMTQETGSRYSRAALECAKKWPGPESNSVQ